MKSFDSEPNKNHLFKFVFISLFLIAMIKNKEAMSDFGLDCANLIRIPCI